MQRFLTLAALVIALTAHADPAAAVGFGRVIGSATLGQPLNLSVVLRLDAGETLTPDCVKAAVNAGDRRLPTATVRTRLEGTGSERRLRIQTTLAIDEPIVAVDLSVGCPVQLSREFVVFADPPPTVASPALRAEPVAPLVPVVPAVVTPPEASAPSSAPAAPTRARPSRASTRATTAEPRPTEAAPTTSRRATTARRTKPQAPRGPVLKLDPIEEEAQAVPLLRMAGELSALPVPGAASRPVLTEPETDAHRRDREHMNQLESTLKQLQAMQNQRDERLVQTQNRVREVEAERYANPLVYSLVALCGVLSAGLLLLFMLRRRDRRSATWWHGPETFAPGVELVPAAGLAEEVVTAEAAKPPAVDPPVLIDEAPPSWKERTVRLSPTPPPEPAPEPEPPAVIVSPSPPAPPPVVTEVPEPRRPMSAEELIDLEQQAEFFVVLGQDESAIDLLMSHLRSTGGVSPVPYLKLLEIYRRRGEQDAHERIRERFNRRFNAYAPEWHVDPDQGLALEGYPDVLSRLQATWSSPGFAMEQLDAALFRRDNGPTFDVPAYRELLFLYGVARDLAERSIETDGVDFLLPLEVSADARLARSIVTAAPPPADSGLSVDLDVSLDSSNVKRRLGDTPEA